MCQRGSERYHPPSGLFIYFPQGDHHRAPKRKHEQVLQATSRHGHLWKHETTTEVVMIHTSHANFVRYWEVKPSYGPLLMYVPGTRYRIGQERNAHRHMPTR